MSLLFGLRHIHFRGLSSSAVVVDGDSAIVIRWMSKESKGPWRLTHLLKEATFLVSPLNISFNWIPREANELADRLENWGVDKEDIVVGSFVEM